MSKGDICSLSGCTNICKSKNICETHRCRKYYNGDYELHPTEKMLKAGKPCLTKYGYIRIKIDKKRIFQHRYIMEQFLERPLKKGEVVHHINGIKTDNRIENLTVFGGNSTHISKCHKKRFKVDWNVFIPVIESRKLIHSKITKCLIPSCNNNRRCLNLCKKHYQSYYKYYHH